MRHLLGEVLAVCIERDNERGAGLDGERVARAQGGPTAAVAQMAGHHGAGGLGGVHRAVARAVVHHDHRGGQAAHPIGHPRHHRAHVLGLVEGGDHDEDPVANPSVEVGQGDFEMFD